MTGSSKLWLRSLTIHRYEQFRDCPRVEFSPDDNLILGINGSGKTSLLRLLAAVLRWNYDALLGQPFDIEFEQVLDDGAGSPVSIAGRVQYQPAVPGAAQQAQIRRAARSRYEGLEARFDMRHGSGRSCTAEVRDSNIHVTVDGTAFEGETPVTPWIADCIAESLAGHCDSDDPEGESVASIPLDVSEHAFETFVVRETDIDFTELTERISYDGILRPPPEHSYSVMAGQWGALVEEVLIAAIEAPDPWGHLPPVAYGRDAGEDELLDMRSLLAALGAERISFRPRIEKSENIDDGVQFEGKGVEIRVLFPSGTEIVDSRLTFGQKRLITIALGALICGGSPLLVDEIDNGLHPGLLEQTLQLIRGRQTFIASHNKLVVDLLDYDSPEDICRTIHICRRNPDGTQKLVPLSDDQVREVFEKIEVGIMSPSDVLLQEGLW